MKRKYETLILMINRDSNGHFWMDEKDIALIFNSSSFANDKRPQSIPIKLIVESE